MYEWLFAPPGLDAARSWDPKRRATVALRQAIDSHDCGGARRRGRTGDLVGFCTAYQDLHSVRFGYRVWVEDLAVHPERRSEGIGKALLDAAKAWARERGATHLELDSAETRARRAPLLRARAARAGARSASPGSSRLGAALGSRPAARSAGSRSRWNSTRRSRPSTTVHTAAPGAAISTPPVRVVPFMVDEADHPVAGVDHLLEVDPDSSRTGSSSRSTPPGSRQPRKLELVAAAYAGPTIATSKSGIAPAP